MVDKPSTVDEYLDAFPGTAQALLRQLREISRAGARNAVEGLKWGSPAYSLESILFVFSGHKRHANFVFTPSTREAFANELTAFKTGKGSVQLLYTEPVPSELLGRMIQYRLKEFEVDGVKWM
ncbi:iron chaperone [Arthrobacter monumenti]